MARILILLGIVLALLVAFAATVGVLAYGNEPPREGRLEVAGLGGPVTLAWSDSGQVWIAADTEGDLAAGLGYAHAADHGWAVMLWRQAASGMLAEWFGDDARALDLHARTLGFADLARQSYEALPEEDRALLTAYASGVNRAFAEAGVAQGDAFVVTGVVPAPWEPWDALAVERLHAYLAAPALASDSTWLAAVADSTVAAFVEADSTFRAFLGMTGGGYDRVYTVGDGANRTLVQQVSAGSSALPLLATAVLRLGDAPVVAATIPGTLASPAGWRGGLGWGLLLGAPLVLERYAGDAPPPVHSRIVERDGDETLLTVPRDSSGLVLRPGTRRPVARADTALADTTGAEADSVATGLRVRWRGFRLGADLGAFRALRGGRLPDALTVLDGAGLAATPADTRVLGRPAIAVQRGSSVLVARSPLAREAADALAQEDTTAEGLRRIPDNVLIDGSVSAWARRYARDLLGALGNRDSLPDAVEVPYSYLRSWGGAYRPDAIAPSVFEWWLVSHRELTGHLPDITDSLDVALLPYSLRIARAELRDRYGPLPSEWRWGTLQGGPRYPVLGGRESAVARRYRGELGPPGGHPTALLPGPGLVFEGEQPGLAVWTIATRLGDGRMTVRSPGTRPPPSGGLDPASGAMGTAVVLAPRTALPRRRLTLVPPT